MNLEHVGVILGFQVSRLSRANSDWYHLLERCVVFHTLLADQDGIYDPTLYNDRLLLGLKGTMTEAELHFLKQRLYHGRLNKARRGELFTMVPTGYVRLPGDRIALDPDELVQLVVPLIFDKFDKLGSVGAVLRYLVRHDIKLGMRVQSGPDTGRLEWHRAIRGTLHTIIRHPIYAGCYAFGFRRDGPLFGLMRISGHIHYSKITGDFRAFSARRWELSIVRRPEGAEGWVRLPIRWTVERTFAWLGQCRRLTKDREKSVRSSEAFIRLAMIHLMLNRIEPTTTDAEFHYREAA